MKEIITPIAINELELIDELIHFNKEVGVYNIRSNIYLIYKDRLDDWIEDINKDIYKFNELAWHQSFENGILFYQKGDMKLSSLC